MWIKSCGDMNCDVIFDVEFEKQVKKQFDSVRQEQANAQGFGQNPPKQEERVKKPKVDKDDYIEFEEL